MFPTFLKIRDIFGLLYLFLNSCNFEIEYGVKFMKIYFLWFYKYYGLLLLIVPNVFQRCSDR